MHYDQECVDELNKRYYEMCAALDLLRTADPTSAQWRAKRDAFVRKQEYQETQ